FSPSSAIPNSSRSRRRPIHSSAISSGLAWIGGLEKAPPPPEGKRRCWRSSLTSRLDLDRAELVVAFLDLDLFAGFARRATLVAHVFLPDHELQVASRRVLDFEFAVSVGHRVIGVVEHPDPALHPRVNV